MWEGVAHFSSRRSFIPISRFSRSGRGFPLQLPLPLLLFLFGNPSFFPLSSGLCTPLQVPLRNSPFTFIASTLARSPTSSGTRKNTCSPLHRDMKSFSTTPTVTEATTMADDSPQGFVPLNQSVWWKESTMRREAVDKCVLPLKFTDHKGSSGRIGVLGGSARYTGAPFYAGMASLKVGADLAFCFCAEEASIPIKSYSPELVVIPVYKASEFDALQLRKAGTTTGTGTCTITETPSAKLLIQKMVDEVCEMLEKLHVLVIGPGLGRCPFVMEATTQIIDKALSINIPLVIDADALFILTLPKYKTILNRSLTSTSGEQSSNKSPVILTPNAMEWQRLQGLTEFWDPDRVIVLQKGREDIIRYATTHDTDKMPGSERFMHCREFGGLKRSGGIGDVLAGTLGTILAWNGILVTQGAATRKDLPLACWLACSIVKRSTHVAYHHHHRAMTAPDVLNALGPTFHDMTTARAGTDSSEPSCHTGGPI